MTFEVYFKTSKEDNLADIIRLPNVATIKVTPKGGRMFFFDSDGEEIARMHTDYICNIVPQIPATQSKSPAESIKKLAEALDGCNMTSDPVDF